MLIKPDVTVKQRRRAVNTLFRRLVLYRNDIAVAILCRDLGRILPGRSLSLLRSFLYIGLFLAWGISLRRRVMQPQVRRLATGIAALMVFWIAERTVKYFFVTDPDVVRWLWYLYYLPMLVIPLLAVFVAASLGRSERYRLPRWTRLLYLPVGALVALVLTNDFHQLVFVFPPEAAVWRDGDFSHAAGYFAAIGRALFLQERTVKYHMDQMIQKCGFQSKQQLIAAAIDSTIVAALDD